MSSRARGALLVLLALVGVLAPSVALTGVAHAQVPVIEAPPVEPGPPAPSPDPFAYTGPGSKPADGTIAKWLYCMVGTPPGKVLDPGFCSYGVIGQTDSSPSPGGGTSVTVDATDWYGAMSEVHADTGDLTADPWDSDHVDSLVLAPIDLDPEVYDTNLVIGTMTDGTEYYVRFPSGDHSAYYVGVRLADGVSSYENWIGHAWDSGHPHLFLFWWLWQTGGVRVMAQDYDTTACGAGCGIDVSYYASRTVPSFDLGPDIRSFVALPGQVGSWWRDHLAGYDWIHAIQDILMSTVYTVGRPIPSLIPIPETPTTEPAPDPSVTPSTICFDTGCTPTTVADPGAGSDTGSIFDWLGSLGDRIGSFFTNLTNAIGSLVAKLVGQLAGWLQWLNTNIAAGLRWMTGTIDTFLEQVSRVVVTGFNDLKVWGTEAWQTMFDWQAKLADLLVQLLGWMNGWLSTLDAHLLQIPEWVAFQLRQLFWPTVTWSELTSTVTGTDPLPAPSALPIPDPLNPTDPIGGPPTVDVCVDTCTPTSTPTTVIPPSPDPSDVACGPSVYVPTPVSRTYYFPTPSTSGCPGNGAGGSRTYGDDQAGDVFGKRTVVRSLAALLLWVVFLFRVARSMPWAQHDELTEGLAGVGD